MELKKPLYLDYNAGAPLHPSVMECLRHFSSLTGNPSSVHSFGQEISRAIQKAKKQILSTLTHSTQTNEDDLHFTGSGTEAAQFVWATIELSNAEKEISWTCSSIEHKATLDTSQRYECCGEKVTRIGIEPTGMLKEFAPQDNHAYSFHWVNNETGVIWPVLDWIGKIRTKQNTWVHIDACQVWGKMPFDVMDVGADFITFSSHKIGGLPGLGLVWVNPKHRKKIQLPKTGTTNVFGVLACAEASKHIPSTDEMGRLAQVQARFEENLKRQIPSIRINGETQPRVPNTTHFTLPGLKKKMDLVLTMDLAGFAVSAGSACSAGVIEPSHVTLAYGYDRSDAIHSLRVSYGPTIRSSDLDSFVSALKNKVFPS